jgi:hypothetical protein
MTPIGPVKTNGGSFGQPFFSVARSGLAEAGAAIKLIFRCFENERNNYESGLGRR